MTIRLLCLLAALAVLPAAAAALDRGAAERQFRVWLAETVWPRARAEGVSRATFDAALRGVELNWDLPELVPPGAPEATPEKQLQAEFGSPARYFAGRKLDDAAARGRRMARAHAGALTAAEVATGVPGRIVLAVWGRESGYGRAAIRHDAFAVLATKGFMSTRRELFTDELVAALRIAEAGLAPDGRLRGSWAGALGQPQFLPSAYLRFARDGDGDGRADIWESEDDTIASIAAYLAHFGWVAGRDWGFEVELPDSVSCTLEGPDLGRPIAEWAKMGIARVSGRPFPAHERAVQGFLMLPAGRRGPAFVVTPNFYVLKKYNESDLYALFVGHLGDRIQYGMGDFRGRWGSTGGLTRGEVAAIQRGLGRLGHDTGGIDGLAGFKTRRAIGRWQRDTGRRETCFPDPEMAAALSR